MGLIDDRLTQVIRRLEDRESPLRDLAPKAQDILVSRSPVRSGTLRGSWRIEVIGDSLVVHGAPYAVHVDTHRPFLKDALDAIRAALIHEPADAFRFAGRVEGLAIRLRTRPRTVWK